MDLKQLRILTFLLIPLLLFSPGVSAKKKGAEGAKSRTEFYRELDLFSKVLQLIREDYVEDVKEKEVLFGAIRGMLSTLDPHSIFLPPDVYRELKIDTEGRFGGVGLEITLKDNLLTVVTPIEGSPAARAGIHEGDRILRIDGVPTKELELGEAVRKMRGPRGSRVHLLLVREGSKEPFDITLTRDIIRIKSIRWEVPEEGYGYVRVNSFQEDTAVELERALESLQKKTKGDFKGLILDLRNNPGGLLDEAVDMANLFLNSGTIVTTVSRDKEIDKRVASKEGTEPTYPIVVLVNGGTASAAEIVAGALQDHKRAVLLGTQTFGKGSVQTIFDLGDGAGLKLTVAKYYTPKGRSIQAEGVSPDIIVEARRATDSSPLPDRLLREKDLEGHLASEKKIPHKQKKVVIPPASTSESEDYQKKVALDYLSRVSAGLPKGGRSWRPRDE